MNTKGRKRQFAQQVRSLKALITAVLSTVLRPLIHCPATQRHAGAR